MLRRSTCLAAISLIGAAMLALAGCQRSLVAVRESGDTHFELREFEQAAADYEEYLNRRPGNAEIHYKLSKTYMELDKVGLAREHALVAHAMRVEDDEIFATTAETLFRDGRYEELNKLLRQRTIDRGRMRDFMSLADYSLRQGDLDEAQRALLTAAQVDGGKSAKPHLELARLYLKIGDTKRARERLGMAYYADPRDAEVVEEIRKSGETPGPTFAVVPPESGSHDK